MQDGASTDGTAEFLQRVEGIPGVHAGVGTGYGIGQAFNRALGRCRGAIIGSIDADNLLQPEALAIAVRRFAEQPEAAADPRREPNITPEGELLGRWIPPAFDLLGLLDGWWCRRLRRRSSRARGAGRTCGLTKRFRRWATSICSCGWRIGR